MSLQFFPMFSSSHSIDFEDFQRRLRERCATPAQHRSKFFEKEIGDSMVVRYVCWPGGVGVALFVTDLFVDERLLNPGAMLSGEAFEERFQKPTDIFRKLIDSSEKNLRKI